MNRFCNILPLLLLFSCTMGPDYEQPQFWSDEEIAKSVGVERASDKVSVFWYKIFEDENLNVLIEEALRNGTDVKVALAKLRQSRYVLLIKETDFLPMFDAEGQYNYAYAPKYAEFGRKSDYFKVGIDAVWELDIWGAGRREKESYQALFAVAKNNLDSVKLSLTAEVALEYINMRVAQEQLRISKNNLRLQEDIKNIVKNKYDAGVADSTDLDQAEYAVQTTKALIPDLAQQEVVYRNSLSVLLGKLPVDCAEFDDKKYNLTAKTFVFDVKKLRQISIENLRARPDVKMAENMLISKNAEIGQAVAQMFPAVSLQAFLGRQAHSFGSLDSAKNAVYAYAPMIDMPFFHWGALQNLVKQNKAIKEEYLYNYQKVLLAAVQDVRNAISAVEKEYDKNEALQKAANNIKDVLENMKAKYKQGLVDFSDLLSSEQQLLDAQNNLVASRGALYQKIVAFYKAIGGGY